MNYKKYIPFIILVIISLIMLTSNFFNSKPNENPEPSIPPSNIIESPDNSFEDEDTSESSDIETIIWIKNINVIVDKGQSYDTMMALKSKLNTELKTIDKGIYEVILLEETYIQTENGYKIQATADKLEGVIYITYSNYEYVFTIIR